jgi:hypothetical protein
MKRWNLVVWDSGKLIILVSDYDYLVVEKAYKAYNGPAAITERVRHK